MHEFFNYICPKDLQNSRIFHDINFCRKCQKGLHDNCSKILFRIFGGGGGGEGTCLPVLLRLWKEEEEEKDEDGKTKKEKKKKKEKGEKNK